MSSATIPIVEETVFEDLWPYKRQEKKSTKGGGYRGTQAQQRNKPRNKGRSEHKQRRQEGAQTQEKKKNRTRGTKKESKKKTGLSLWEENPEHKTGDQEPQQKNTGGLKQRKIKRDRRKNGEKQRQKERQGKTKRKTRRSRGESARSTINVTPSSSSPTVTESGRTTCPQLHPAPSASLQNQGKKLGKRKEEQHALASILLTGKYL
ncbi:hypothetical protein NC651_001825 [Populus alba x Populus x berolinensis]|nr:hypothetical protein NC651_001825 [Populus alba x Populus x berolinensis]